MEFPVSVDPAGLDLINDFLAVVDDQLGNLTQG